jgi:hypothetical protein
MRRFTICLAEECNFSTTSSGHTTWAPRSAQKSRAFPHKTSVHHITISRYSVTERPQLRPAQDMSRTKTQGLNANTNEVLTMLVAHAKFHHILPTQGQAIVSSHTNFQPLTIFLAPLCHETLLTEMTTEE